MAAYSQALNMACIHDKILYNSVATPFAILLLKCGFNDQPVVFTSAHIITIKREK